FLLWTSAPYSSYSIPEIATNKRFRRLTVSSEAIRGGTAEADNSDDPHLLRMSYTLRRKNHTIYSRKKPSHDWNDLGHRACVSKDDRYRSKIIHCFMLRACKILPQGSPYRSGISSKLHISGWILLKNARARRIQLPEKIRREVGEEMDKIKRFSG
ncbi:hypothetical protein ACO22_06713, partial [Paracoccidioides brasiliensis]